MRNDEAGASEDATRPHRSLAWKIHNSTLPISFGLFPGILGQSTPLTYPLSFRLVTHSLASSSEVYNKGNMYF